jgi:hypothetical protein
MANNTSVGVYQANIMRAYKLTSLGHPDQGAGLLYSTDSVIEVVSTPNYETGQTIRQENGSGQACIAVKQDDSYNFHDLTTNICKYDAHILNFLAGDRLITDGSNVVGSGFNTDPQTTFVAIELYQTIVDGSEPTGEYLVTVFPKTRWRRGATTRNAQAATFPLVGVGYANTNIGRGPDGTYPGTVAPYEPEFQFITSVLPAAATEPQAVSVGS